MKSEFSFNAQLQVGELAEALFVRLFSASLKKAKTRKYDFDIISGEDEGKTLELKTDCWISENIFIEKVSDINKDTLGGPWQTLNNQVDLYSYFLPMYGKILVFDAQDLVSLMERLIFAGKLRSKEIPNKTWKSLGYPVNRSFLEQRSLKIIDLKLPVFKSIRIEIDPLFANYIYKGLDYSFIAKGEPYNDLTWKPFKNYLS